MIVLCAALAFSPVFAQELVARQGDDSVRLNDGPCASEQVISRLEPATAREYKSASAQLAGQRFVACWREMGGVAHLVYEDGDQGVIPMAELKPELAA
jgi:hypothetical protein